MKPANTFIILCVLTILACCGEDKIVYPEGGYRYPKHIEDSSYYFYPLKEAFSRRDSFYSAFEYMIYKPFNELNLSLSPPKEDIFRLTYTGFKQYPVIILLTHDKLVIKTGNTNIFHNEDMAALSLEERVQYRNVRYHFPHQRICKRYKRAS